MSINVTKGLVLAEDIEFGFEASTQDRGGDQFNASHIPYSLTDSIKGALDDRYTSAYMEANFAKLGGLATQLFLVADGTSGSEAVNFQQLDLRETKVVVATKANISGDSTQEFNVANATNPTEATSKQQVDTELALKEDITSVDTKLALKAEKANVLERDGADVYTPLNDYNPATKKFVDDSIFTAFQTGVSGQFTAGSGETITVTNGLITGII